MRTHLISAVLLAALLGCGGAQSPSEPADGVADGPAADEGGPSASAEGAAGEASTGTDGQPAAGPGDEAKPPAAQKCKKKAPPKGETDDQRKRRLKREKLAECQTVAEAIQKAQLVTTITTVDDKEKLAEVSGKLDKAAAELERLAVCVDGLRKLRDEYSGRARAMSKALSTAATTTEIDKQKASIAEFRKLHPLQGEFVNKINEFCNAPVE